MAHRLVDENGSVIIELVDRTSDLINALIPHKDVINTVDTGSVTIDWSNGDLRVTVKIAYPKEKRHRSQTFYREKGEAS